MADIATLLTVAQTLFAALQCSNELKEMCSIWGYKSKLQDLKDTISTIKKVLIDAEEAKHELSNEALEWILKLKDAVYDADDLFDEFLTLAELNKQHFKGAKFTKKVHRFFSTDNQLSVAYRMSQGVNNVRKKLDSIVSNHSKFGFTIDHERVRRRKEETCSYVYASDIVGREGDLKAVLDMLLDFNCREYLHFVSVVGVGGIGKTTLAQLVFSHDKVKSEFELRLWVCVSDQDGEQFDVKAILGKILESATRKNDYDGFGLDLLQSRLQEELGGKKYLLVLDDVWNEDRYRWLELRNFLMVGGRGSRILVTTRSKQTMKVVGTGYMYELRGLSEENSWLLFEMTAFEKGCKEVKSDKLVEIGKKIVKRCANVPLAIKVVGSLLFGQEESKWRLFEEIGLAKISNGDNEFMSILMFSYQNLESPLKSCFSYCALFPKDFVMEKEMLISLWMAQGYIVPLDGGQSIEDAGEEYFSILLRRCFFQDIKKDQYGEIVSCKIHDLMHELAEEVAGREIWIGTSITSALERKSRHLFHVGSNCADNSFTKMKIRSYLRTKWACTFPLHSLIANWMSSLRTLDLHNLNMKELPDSMGKLLHLRYLDLSNNSRIKRLPNSITRLFNLQTLNLAGCLGIEQLPNDFSKLVKLRHLDISHCNRITHMFSGIDKLTSLQVLTAFVVANGSCAKKQYVGQLEDLKALNNLKGSIRIVIPEDFTIVNLTDNGGGYLRRLERLKTICICFQFNAFQENASLVINHETLLAELQPHPNTRGLNLYGYQGGVIPRWGRADDNWGTFLPNLVKVEIRSCRRVKHLPSLSKLAFLKSLQLYDLSSLEYMENASSSSSELVFFPSLEELNLDKLVNLKGWWNNRQGPPSFPCLLKLLIRWCPSLTSFPPCPSVEKLCLRGLNESLDAIAFLSDISSSQVVTVREVETDNMAFLKSLPTRYLTNIKICSDDNVTSLSEHEEVFKSCSSVQYLTISNCTKIKSLSGGIEHLTALQSLSICRNPELRFSEEHGDGMPWKSLGQTLCSLELKELENLVTLPEGMQQLTTLRKLTIDACWNLKALPEWITTLPSLELVRIKSCYHLDSVLVEMETRQNSQDLPKIQHIPSITIVND